MKKEDPKKFSIIDKGFTIEGTVAGNGRLVIKGTVKGSVSGDNVVIAEEGAIFAKTRCAEMTIGGVFDGAVDVSKTLVILSTGTCSGEVKCHDLIVEAGGALNAKVTCDSKKNQV